MPELIRSAVTRVRVYFKDRRQKPRLRVRLLFTVGIHRPSNGNGNGTRKASDYLKGHTRDISTSGLALLVPRVHLNGHHLAADGRELEIKLELGRFGPINLRAVPRRYERLEDSELGCTYLIGVRIVHIDEADLLNYTTFIKESLGSGAE